MIRVAILGNYPTHYFAERLKCSTIPQAGISTWIVNFTNAISKMEDIDLHVIAKMDQCAKIKQEHNYIYNGCSYHFILSPHLRTATFYLRDCSLLHKTLKTINPDIVHAHHTDEYALAAITSRYPAVITVHGIYSKAAKYINAGNTSRIAIASLIERFCLKKGKYIIAINPYAEKIILKSSHGLVYHIENPVNKVYFNIVERIEHNTVLFIGVFSPIKGLLELIEVIENVRKRIHRVTLRLIGFYPSNFEWYKKKVDYFVSQKDLSDNIQFLGPQNEIEIADELSKTNCLLVTSKQETAPMVISEAMAAGKPVVAMDVGGIRYMVQDGVTGYLVPPGDTQAMAERVVRILEDETLRRTMGEAARKEALQRFHPDLVARKTLAVYEKILHLEHKR